MIVLKIKYLRVILSTKELTCPCDPEKLAVTKGGQAYDLLK